MGVAQTLLALLLPLHASVAVLLTSLQASVAVAARPLSEELGFDIDLVGGVARHDRRLSFVTFKLSLAQQLGNAIIDGDIDEAANILVGAVRGGDSGSVVRGLSMADDRPGIAQTIVRALGMGLDSDDLENAVETGGQEESEAADVVREVLVLVNGNLVQGTQTADGQVIIQSPPSAPPSNPPPPLNPPPPTFSSSGQSFGASSSTPQTTFPPTYAPGTFPVPSPSTAIVPTSIQPTPTPPPSTTTRAFVNGVEVRPCRGQKEEQCCSEFNYSLNGCLCDFSGRCRFEFIHTQPRIIRDNHRPDMRSCMCP